ncbi:hypothetical protein D3C71_1182200 [compost metagenome]
MGVGLDHRSAAFCAVAGAGDFVVEHRCRECGAVDGVGAAPEMAVTGCALHGVDSRGGTGAARGLALALSPGGQRRLAGVGRGVRRAFHVPEAPGAHAGGARDERGPCARLLAIDGCIGSGAALRLAGVVRAIQRLALVGLGDSAQSVSGADGGTSRVALASVGVSTRIPRIRRRAAGVVDARLVLAGEYRQ